MQLPSFLSRDDHGVIRLAGRGDEQHIQSSVDDGDRDR